MGAPDEVGIWQVRAATPSRPEFELRALVANLQIEIADFVEREHVHELEIAAQRRELEVRFAFEATLEERLDDCRREIEELRRHVGHPAEDFVADDDRTASDFAAARQRADDALRERDQVQHVLDAERERISYRAAQGAVAWIHERRTLFRMVRTVARVVEARTPPPKDLPPRV